MNPPAVGELASDAIEAKCVANEERVLEILQTVLVDGNKRDALAFTVACIYTIACGLRPGVEVVIGPVWVSAVGQVGVTHTPPEQGVVLFAELLNDYLGGQFGTLRSRWLAAESGDAAESLASGIAAAASLVRRHRARLN